MLRIAIIVFLGLAVLRTGECRMRRIMEHMGYESMVCRKHAASLSDFDAVGDGRTSNTKAFKLAVDHLSQFAGDGGSLLYVPPGRWLTGCFNLTSHFTLYLAKGAVILGSQDMSEWPLISALPSYGRGRDALGGRFSSLIYGVNLTDVVITGANGTIDGQGEMWWKKFKSHQLKSTRGYLLELMFCDQVLISNITLMNSPSWNVHPVYSTNVIVKDTTVLAPFTSPNTDGINPDSCSNVTIENCYVESGDDCVAIKSGWDEYGIAFGMPTENVKIRRFTCRSPFSAVIAIGSEMSGGVGNVRAEDIVADDTESGVRIKTAIGRGGYIRDIYVQRMTLQTMKMALWITSTYNAHADNNWDPLAIPVVERISYRDIVADNVTTAGRLEGLVQSPATGMCLSNVTIQLARRNKLPWKCEAVKGISHAVTPSPCVELADDGQGSCPFPPDDWPVGDVPLVECPMPTVT